jgi:serine/threonine protein phosphatase PrpC
MWVVADGMGGHEAGDVASQMVVNTLKEIQLGQSLEKYINDIEDALVGVNKKLTEIANQGEKPTTCGSTVVVMLAYEKYCAFLWAGDSRLYRIRDSKIIQLTIDHSQVQLYVEQGLISRDEAESHPHSNMITRAVGATEEFVLDVDMQEMKKGDRYLLCSDGLTKHIPDIDFEKMLAKGDVEKKCNELIDLTLARGAKDNVTAILVDIE